LDLEGPVNGGRNPKNDRWGSKIWLYAGNSFSFFYTLCKNEKDKTISRIRGASAGVASVVSNHPSVRAAHEA